MLHFMLYQTTHLCTKCGLELPVYWTILLCFSFSFKHLLVGVCRKELTFKMKNGRVGRDDWFLPPPSFTITLIQTVYYRGYLRLMQVYQFLGVNEQTVMVSS